MVEPIIIGTIIFTNILILTSLGLTLTYLTTKVPNFAHGSFVTIGAYVGVYAFSIQEISPYYYIPIAFLISGLVALLQYKLVLKPLMDRGANIVILMIATLTVDVFLFGVINIIADWLATTYKIYVTYVIFKRLDFEMFEIEGAAILSTIFVIIIVILLYLLLYKTRFGISMRAVMENPSLSQILGINVDRVLTFSWFLSGGLAGIAGIFYGFQIPVNTTSGQSFLPIIFAASIAGGLNSLFGAIVGGGVVGVLSMYLPYYISRFGTIEILGLKISLIQLLRVQPLIPLVIMAIVLLIFPKGIMGINYPKIAFIIKKNLYKIQWPK
ncbi:MAG: branched-chain amino acid ABC transporter permease [Thermoproteota archaeon]|nr:branched-chain amino acid ABC transporter permease [Thermoproteota archaeon]